jgi:WD40 repeat protein
MVLKPVMFERLFLSIKSLSSFKYQAFALSDSKSILLDMDFFCKDLKQTGISDFCEKLLSDVNVLIMKALPLTSKKNVSLFAISVAGRSSPSCVLSRSFDMPSSVLSKCRILVANRIASFKTLRALFSVFPDKCGFSLDVRSLQMSGIQTDHLTGEALSSVFSVPQIVRKGSDKFQIDSHHSKLSECLYDFFKSKPVSPLKRSPTLDAAMLISICVVALDDKASTSTHVVCGMSNGKLLLIDLQQQTLLGILCSDSNGVDFLVKGHDNKIVYSMNKNLAKAFVWDLKRMKCIRVLASLTPEHEATDAVWLQTFFVSKCHWLVSGFQSGMISYIKSSTKEFEEEERDAFFAHSDAVSGIQLIETNDSVVLITCGEDGTIKMFDITVGSHVCIAIFCSPSKQVYVELIVHQSSQFISIIGIDYHGGMDLWRISL